MQLNIRDTKRLPSLVQAIDDGEHFQPLRDPFVVIRYREQSDLRYEVGSLSCRLPSIFGKFLEFVQYCITRFHLRTRTNDGIRANVKRIRLKLVPYLLSESN